MCVNVLCVVIDQNWSKFQKFREDLAELFDYGRSGLLVAGDKSDCDSGSGNDCLFWHDVFGERDKCGYFEKYYG